MIRRLSRTLLPLDLAILLLGVDIEPAGAAAKATPPPTLTCESFSGIPIFSSFKCDPTGTSSFDYSVSGPAGSRGVPL